jgi:hypothetical protein
VFEALFVVSFVVSRSYIIDELLLNLSSYFSSSLSKKDVVKLSGIFVGSNFY